MTDREHWPEHRVLSGEEPPAPWAEPADPLAAFFEEFPGAVTAYSIAVAAFALAMVLLRVAAHVYFGI